MAKRDINTSDVLNASVAAINAKAAAAGSVMRRAKSSPTRAESMSAYEKRFGYAPPSSMSEGAMKRWVESSFRAGPGRTGDPAYEAVVDKMKGEYFSNKSKANLPSLQQQGSDPVNALKTIASSKSAAMGSVAKRQRGEKTTVQSLRDVAREGKRSIAKARVDITRGRMIVPETIKAQSGIVTRVGGAVMRAATPLAVIGGVSQGVVQFNKARIEGRPIGASISAGLQGAAPAAVGLGAGFTLAKLAPAAAKFAGPIGLAATVGKAVWDGYQGYKAAGGKGAVKGVADSLTFGMASKVASSITSVAGNINPRALGVIGDHKVDPTKPSTSTMKSFEREKTIDRIQQQRQDRKAMQPGYKDEWVDKNNIRHVRHDMNVRKRANA